MGRPTTLPDAAWNNMSDTAAGKIQENVPGIGPQAVNVIEGTSADDILTGTDGPDLFIFDASTSFGNDTIIDYDPNEDTMNVYGLVGWGGAAGPTGFDWIFDGVVSDANWVVARSTLHMEGVVSLELDNANSVSLFLYYNDTAPVIIF